MTHAVSIICGSLSFTIGGANAYCRLKEYQLATPKAVTSQNIATLTNQSAVSWENVSETIELYFTGTTTQIQDAMRDLEEVLEAIRRNRHTGESDFGYVRLQISGEGTSWDSQILMGQLSPETNILTEWATTVVNARLYLNRLPYWETSVSETQLTISSTTTTTPGSQAVITQTANWIDIAAAQLANTYMKTPLRISIVNTSGGSVTPTKIYMGVNYLQTPESFTSRYSLALTNTPGASGLFTLGTVTFTAAQLNYMRGRRIQLFARMTSPPTAGTGLIRGISGGQISATFYPVVYGQFADVTPVDGSSWLNLGALPFPPGGWAQSTAADADFGILQLQGMHIANTYNYAMDNLVLWPSVGTRALEQAAPIALANNDLVGDDPRTGRVFSSISSRYYQMWRASGEHIAVMPNLRTRVYFLITGTNITTTTQFTIRAYIRGRRLLV